MLPPAMIVGLSLLVGAAAITLDFNTNIDCNAWKYKCEGIWDFDCSGKMTKKGVCEAAAKAFASYTGSVENACANDPRRMQGRDFIDRALQTLFSNGILTRQEWEQSGVQVRFCSVLKGITIKISQINLDVEWRATGMAPSPNKILLSADVLNMNSCSEEHIKFLAGVLFHEWHHIQQQRVWGLTGFQCRYFDEIRKFRGTAPETGNTIEIDADRRENEAVERIDEIEVTSCRTKILVENGCRFTSIDIAIFYQDRSGNWESECWWNLDPGDKFFLADNGQALETANLLWYYYAESTDGGMFWRGTDSDDTTRSCDGRRLDMRKSDYVDSNGNLSLRLTCSGEKVPVIEIEERETFNFWVANNCQWTSIYLAIRYRDMSDNWVSECWWNLDPGDSFYLRDDGNTLTTTNKVWYYYAESTDGEKFWIGTDSDDVMSGCGGQNLEMRKKNYVDRDGDLSLTLTCSNESKPTPTPPRPRPTPRPPTPSPPRPRPTLRPPTPSNDLWDAYDGYACRVQGSDSGEKGVDFEKYEGDHVDFGWCMSRCEGWSYCKGFEYRYDIEEGIGKCEIWLRYYGNVEEYFGPNYHYCYWKKKYPPRPRPTPQPPRPRPTPRPPTPSNDLWEAHDGYACRVEGSYDGEEGLHYEKYVGSFYDKQTCMNQCQFRSDYKGFEYKYDVAEGRGYCEIWLRYYGNVQEKSGPNSYFCYWKKINGGGGGLKKYGDTACGFGGDGVENRDFLKRYDVSRDWCKSKCLELGASCHGYDYHYDRERCRVFYRKTTSNVDKDGVDCWLKNTAISPRDGDLPDCAASGKKSRACGGPSDKPAVCCEPERGCDEKRCK